MSVNKAIILGRLGKDPGGRTFENGKTVADFTIATSDKYKDKSGKTVEQTEWHNVILWGGLAEVALKYLHKGDQVYIEGKITTRSWEGKDKQKHYTTEIVAQQLTMLSTKFTERQPQPEDYEDKKAKEAVGYTPASDDQPDLPF